MSRFYEVKPAFCRPSILKRGVVRSRQQFDITVRLPVPVRKPFYDSARANEDCIFEFCSDETFVEEEREDLKRAKVSSVFDFCSQEQPSEEEVQSFSDFLRSHCDWSILDHACKQEEKEDMFPHMSNEEVLQFRLDCLQSDF